MYNVDGRTAALVFGMSVTWAIYGQSKSAVVLLTVSDFRDAMATSGLPAASEDIPLPQIIS